jgi:hypothetical protein
VDNQIERLFSQLATAELQKKPSFSGGNDLINAVIQLLNRFDGKLSAPELLGLLGFCNLLGIVSYLPRDDSGAKHVKAADALVQEPANNKQDADNKELPGLLSMLTGLLSSKDKQGFSPGNMFSLLNLLSSMQNGTDTQDVIVEKSASALPEEPVHAPQPAPAEKPLPDSGDQIRINSKEQSQKSLQWKLPK